MAVIKLHSLMAKGFLECTECTVFLYYHSPNKHKCQCGDMRGFMMLIELGEMEVGATVDAET